MGKRCFICNRVFDDYKSLRIHFKRAHNNSHCDICGAKTDNLVLHYMKKADLQHFIASCIVLDCKQIKDEKLRKVIKQLIDAKLDDSNASM
jgi:hypothetical protein